MHIYLITIKLGLRKCPIIAYFEVNFIKRSSGVAKGGQRGHVPLPLGLGARIDGPEGPVDSSQLDNS